jgi:hypothetical protein
MPALPTLAQALLLGRQFLDIHHSQEAVSENTRHPVALGLAKILRTIRVASYFGNDFPLRRVFENAAAFVISCFSMRYACELRHRIVCVQRVPPQDAKDPRVTRFLRAPSEEI